MTIESQLKIISEESAGDIYDAEYQGGTWMVEAVETREELDHFIASSVRWAECSEMKRGSIGGIKFVVWENMQSHKGARRRSLAVLDFGDVRYAIDHQMDGWTAA